MSQVLMNGIQYGLNDIEKDCWERIKHGSLHYKDPFHHPVVANLQDGHVNQRIVVLRKADTIRKQLSFHTDIRSGKWSDLQTRSAVSWLFYNTNERIQIRLGGDVVLHKADEVTDTAWQQLTINSRKTYLGKDAPSSKINLPESDLPQAFEQRPPTMEETELGRQNFGVVITNVNWMEWLWLNSDGHRRASFSYSEQHSFVGSWLVP